MAVLLVADPRFLEHDTGPGHPERPARLRAVEEGLLSSPVYEDLILVAPRLATPEEIRRVHRGAVADRILEVVSSGGGRLDADTVASLGSSEAAELAAGAGLVAVEHLDAGEADAAFLAVRPPGHHATPSRSMGFCLYNNVAVTAAALADRGERVLVVDYDAHHGNGTQDIFYDDPSVAYVSMHQFPFYPGTGAADEIGSGAGRGTTVNLPMPAGATGDAYRAAIDDVVTPFAERFQPTWLLLSAGFDAHRRDPLTDLGLTSGDFADLTASLIRLVPPGRRIVFLEGGYDLDGLSRSVSAAVSALAGESHRPEPASEGDHGMRSVEAVAELHRRLAAEG